LSLPNSSPDHSLGDSLGEFDNLSEILDGGAELLAHLGRSGMRFVPQPVTTGVDRWTESLTTHFVSSRDIVADVNSNAATPPKPTPSVPNPEIASPSASVPVRLSPANPVVTTEPYPGQSLPIAARIEALDSLAATVMGCTHCKTLASCRTQTVFGEGNPQARFVFVGEAPAAEDDQCGQPFQDDAGHLLTKMIEAMRLKREDVYLLHTVKCRPPGNRNPDQTEVGNCRQYLEAQLQILRPEYIICLGAVSSQALLRSKLSIGRLRQQFHEYHGSKVVVIYSPTYLRRNPEAKKAAWADLQMLMRDAGL
jgi:DNA polymerase